jgi:large subunit ribosomal protein L3
MSTLPALLGRKVGMTRYFLEDGRNIPVTVLAVGPCIVTQIKTTETDGYAAVQLAYEDVRPRNSTMPVIGHDAKAGTSAKRFHREIRLASDDDARAYQIGQSLTSSVFDGVKYVEIVSTSKGKGFEGVMKRHNFAGMGMSHGVERMHRHGGSISAHATNRGTGPKPKKGKRMPGRLGGDTVTTRCIQLVAIRPDENLILVKGTVPGATTGFVLVRQANRLNRQKARLAKSSA